MLAGRPHEAARQRQSQMDDRRPAQAGTQNPAYRPTHPPSCALNSGGTLVTKRSGRFRGTCPLFLLQARWGQAPARVPPATADTATADRPRLTGHGRPCDPTV